MQFGLLQVKLGGCETVERPGMVVMHVGPDHVREGGCQHLAATDPPVADRR
jgi:hypothetical protein